MADPAPGLRALKCVQENSAADLQYESAFSRAAIEFSYPMRIVLHSATSERGRKLRCGSTHAEFVGVDSWHRATTLKGLQNALLTSKAGRRQRSQRGSEGRMPGDASAHGGLAAVVQTLPVPPGVS